MAKKTLRRISGFIELGKTRTAVYTFVIKAIINFKIKFVNNLKDTVSTDEKEDKIDGNQDAWDDGPPIGHNAIVHDGGPVLPCEDL